MGAPRCLRIAAFAAALSLLACNSLVAHGGLDPEVQAQIGNPYSGVRLNLKSWQCLPTVIGQYPPVAAFFLAPLSAILLIVDLPLSAVGDTLLLPVDLAVDPRAAPIDPGSARCE